MKRIAVVFLVGIFMVLTTGCGGGGGGGESGEVKNPVPVPASTSGASYIVMAWNDIGMHCLNPEYDKAVILPPSNTVVAQVIKRGNPPQVVTGGVTVEFALANNTSSAEKRLYGQFWTYAQKLFGVSPAKNVGLTGTGLSGSMKVDGTQFKAEAIPVVPVDDAGVWNPYQQAIVTVKDAAGTTVAQTRATVPVSDEINCAKCHGANPFTNILQAHDKSHNTTLEKSTPVLCASCHGSPALGKSNSGSTKYLSQALHGFHASKNASCQDCHPGAVTKCNRSLKHTAADGNCVACHGTMTQVADSIAKGTRIPWTNEPACTKCHSAAINQVDTGTTLYRNSKGHGNLYCEACHGSPHAMVPSREASDNYQALQYQNKAVTMGSCKVCHSASRGEGSSEFGEKHGGTSPRQSTACNVCHTGVSTNTDKWPHAFQWKSR